MPAPRLWSASIRKYFASLGLVALSMAARLALDPLMGTHYPYLLQFVTVLGCAWYFGFGPAIAGMVLATLPSLYTGLTVESSVRYWVALPVVCGVAVLLVWLIARQRRLLNQTELSAQFARERLEALTAEKSEREREERYSAQWSAIVENSEDAIISKNLEGVIESWNSGAERTFGYTAEEAIGRSMALLVPPNRAAEEAEIIERIRRGGRVTHFETVRVRKDGRQIDVSLTISPVRNPRGEVVGVSHVARDITEQKKFAGQMLQAQKLESLGVLAGGLAHDFNNLLTGVLGNGSLALEELDSSHPARGRLEEIVEAGERAAVLVQQMLAYAGKARLLARPLDLSRQVSESAPLIRASLGAGAQLQLELERDLPTVEADPAQMQQMIINLAVNAAEAVGQSGGTITVRTAWQDVDSELQVVLQVRDTGCGMDHATKARIFDPFFSTKFAGRGLGLAAVLGIIRAHRGSIAVESAPGRGSTFTVVLPAGNPEPPEALESQDAERGHGQVLVVDDEELVRNMARLWLQQAGFAVETASDGQSALEIFSSASRGFDAVLLDLSLPGETSEETIEALRHIRPNLPMVFCSSLGEGETAKKLADNGFAVFLLKPYTATTLTRKLRQALKLGRSRV
jgi:PAS domain S-box-containing protein